MRGLKVRSADTLPNWSAALLADTTTGGLREYIDAQDILAMPKTGGTFTGPVILANDALTAFGAVTLQQMNAAVATAINDLIASAPVTLDTLQEIANALNNDASAVTNLLALIGNKADLAGATFTGPVIVPSNTTQGNVVVNLNDVQALIAAISSAPTLVFDSAVFTDNIVGQNRSIGFAQSGVTPGPYTKVTTDIYGRITAGDVLQEGDLPTVLVNAGGVFNTGTALAISTALNMLQQAVDNVPVVDTSLFVAKSGDTMTGDLVVPNLRAAYQINLGESTTGPGVNMHTIIGQYATSVGDSPFTLLSGNSFLDRNELLLGGNTNYGDHTGVQKILFYTSPSKNAAAVLAFTLDRTGKLFANNVYALSAAGDVVLKSHLDAAIASAGTGLNDYVIDNGETIVSYTNATKIHDVVLSDQGITPGAYTKVTLNSKGVATAAAQLAVADLPLIVPQQGFTFTGGSYTILAAINALDTTCQNLSASINMVDNKDGAEENWVGNSATTTFAFNTIDWLAVQSKPRRLFVFVDGLRQPPGQYSVGPAGLTFGVAPVSGAEIEAVFIA